jgi:uncharacterized protein YjiS (DUF1127 family)
MQRNVPLTDQCDQRSFTHHNQVWGDTAMLVAFLFDTVGRYLRYRFQLASIGELDDRTLRDIGLTRSELRAAAWNTAARRAPN